jgi:hypothetical protein
MRIFLLLLFIVFLRGEEEFNATFFNELNSSPELNLTDNNITDETNKSIENNLTKKVEVEIIDIEFPPLIEENLTNENIVNLEEHKLKVAIILNKDKFFKYIPSLLSSVEAYVLNKDIDFEIKIFDEKSDLDNIVMNFDNVFIFSTNPDIVETLKNYNETNFYFPILNKSQIKTEIGENMFFGGLNFKTQIKKLNRYISGYTILIKDKSEISEYVTTIEKEELLFPTKIIKYPIKYRNRIYNNVFLYLNTDVVQTSQILANFTYHQTNPKYIFSTQINYNPLIFSLTSRRDTYKMIIANSLLGTKTELLDKNMNLGSDIKYNWLNFTTSALLNKAYNLEMNENQYFLNDFNLYLFNNQIQYKTSLYRISRNGFIKIVE